MDLENIVKCIPDVEMLAGKSILITGATGLIGSYLVDFFLYMNQEYAYKMKVYALGRDSKRLQNRFISNKDSSDLHFIVQDVTKPIEIKDSIDYIIHAAGDGYPAAFREHPVETMTPAFIGTYNLLMLANQLQVTRLLYISSGEIYGHPIGREHAFLETESGAIDSMNARSCYPVAKKAAETLCVSFSQEYGIHTTIVRPGHTYGATISTNDNRATVQFLREAFNREDIIMHSKGLQMRSYTYVADCVSAILTVLLHGENEEAYNIANETSRVTIAEFAQTLAKMAGVCVLTREPDDKQKKELTPITYAVLDSTKLQALGWKGSYDIETGISQMYQIAHEKGTRNDR